VPNKKQYQGLDMNGYKVTGLPAPSADSDAVSKEWVEANAGGSPTATNVTYTAPQGFPTTPNNPADNVQEAIDNLFTYANSGKNDVADSIGYATPYSDTFVTLAGNIDTAKSKLTTFLPKAEQTILSTDKLHDLANKLDNVRVFKKRTKLRKASGSTEQVIFSKNFNPEDLVINVLQLNGDSLNNTLFEDEYDNDDEDDFFSNPNVSFTTDFVEIPTKTNVVDPDSTTVYSGGTVRSYVMNFDNLNDFRITNINTATVTNQTLAGPQIIVASGDLDITNMSEFYRINFTVSRSATSTPNPSDNHDSLMFGSDYVGYAVKYAMSFDGGLSWMGFPGPAGQYETPDYFDDIYDLSEWQSKGTLTNRFSLSSNSFSSNIINTLYDARNGSNTLRFAYRLEKFKIGQAVYLDKLTIGGLLKGNLEPANASASVSYNSINKTATVTFNTQDTFQINWID
jgi:hypothetical protein